MAYIYSRIANPQGNGKSLASRVSDLMGNLIGTIPEEVARILERYSTKDKFNRDKILYGPELVPNGFVSSEWAWTLWSVSGGVATASAATQAISRGSTIVAGRTYKVTITCNSHTSGSWKVLYEGGQSLFGDKTSAGTFEATVTANATGGIYIWPNTALTASFSSISIKEVLQVPSGIELSSVYSQTVTANTYGSNVAGAATGKIYKVSATVTKTSGAGSIDVGITNASYGWHTNGVSWSGTNGTTNISFTVKSTDATVVPTVIFTNAVGSVTNLSVMEMVNATMMGPELAPALSSGSWSGSGWTTSSDSAAYNGLSGTSALSTGAITFVAGKTYKCDVYIASNTGTGTNPLDVAGAQRINSSHLNAGVFSTTFTVPTTASSFMLYGRSGEPLTISGISVREIFATEAHLYLPGVGIINGFATGNYQDSAGATAGAVDSVVGLALDGAGGPVVVTPASSGWGVASGITKDTTANTATFSGSQSAYATLSLGGASVVGATYRVTATVSGATQGELQSLIGGVVSYPFGIGAAGNKTVTFHVVATGTGGFGFQDNGGQGARFNGSISAITITQITGTHASQSTTANKPLLRKGIVNLLTYSNDLTNANWPMVAASYVSGQSDPFGGNSAFKIVDSTSNAQHHAYNTIGGANGVYTQAAILKAAEFSKVILDMSDLAVGDCSAVFDLSNGSVSEQTGNPWQNVTASIAPIPGSPGWFMCALSATRNATGSSVRGFIRLHNGSSQTFAGTGTQGIVYYRSGIFQGTLTASQILAAGGIPLTTSAAASSTAGNHFWQFDGSNDSLALGSVLFQMSDDHCVVLGFSASNTSTTGVAFSQGAANSRVPSIYTTGGHAFAAWRDDTASGPTIDVGAVSQDTALVFSARKIGSTVKAAINGNAEVSVSGTWGVTTVTSAVISGTPTNSAPLIGSFIGCVAIKGAVSDADALILKKFIGRLAGVTI